MKNKDEISMAKLGLTSSNSQPNLFTFDYNDFVFRFNKLDNKYNNNLLEEISNDMNILEEFYIIN